MNSIEQDASAGEATLCLGELGIVHEVDLEASLLEACSRLGEGRSDENGSPDREHVGSEWFVRGNADDLDIREPCRIDPLGVGEELKSLIQV